MHHARTKIHSIHSKDCFCFLTPESGGSASHYISVTVFRKIVLQELIYELSLLFKYTTSKLRILYSPFRVFPLTLCLVDCATRSIRFGYMLGQSES
jgi:hypothetical protein